MTYHLLDVLNAIEILKNSTAIVRWFVRHEILVERSLLLQNRKHGS